MPATNLGVTSSEVVRAILRSLWDTQELQRATKLLNGSLTEHDQHVNTCATKHLNGIAG